MTNALALPASAFSAHPAVHLAFAHELEALAMRLRDVTVRIHTRAARYDAVGAGVLWPPRARRLVVTNAHVVRAGRGDLVGVETADGRVVEGAVAARDCERDLAAIVLPEAAGDWPAPVVLGDARGVRVGEIVVALGHPMGVGGALSFGVLHAKPNDDASWLRADIRLAPGNSGGPLATLDGSVIGVNCMVASGLGIAIPAHVVDEFVREGAAVS
ncbi:MAG TPA: serine protease [Gemmatimonadaceae bacterium]